MKFNRIWLSVGDRQCVININRLVIKLVTPYFR